MNNKGFALIETIIMIVILLTTLVVLYSSYSNIIIKEKERLYYDDISYIYKTFAIKNILDISMDHEKFKEAYNSNDSYIYFFNVGTENIFSNETLLDDAKKLYNFKGLGYFKIKNIENIKNCIKGSNDDSKCNHMLESIDNNKYTNLENYLLQLNVPDDNISVDGVLISMIYEAKNGEKNIDSGQYQNCIINKVKDHYNLSNPSDDELKKALDKYYDDGNLDFDMACQNAYYISWVYL